MTRAGRVVAAGAAALVLALGGACSTSSEPAAPRDEAPIQTGWQGCEHAGAFADHDSGSDAAPPPSGGVPSGFAATSVVLCVAETGVGADGDVVVLRGVERTSTEVGPLLTYLAQPDERPSDDPCAADGWVMPLMVLVDDHARFVHPAIPVDGCGKPSGWYDRDARPLVWDRLTYTDRVVRTR